MGRRGPPKTPTAVMVARGADLSGKRSRDLEPDADPLTSEQAQGSLPMGVEGDAVATEFYLEASRLLTELRVLTTADTMALAMGAFAMSDFMAIRQQLEAEEIATDTKYGGKTLNPLYRAQSDAWSRVLKAMREFGMTPASRTGVHVTQPKEDDDGKASYFES